jgi:hypothetical protein
MPSQITDMLAEIELQRKAINAISGPQVHSRRERDKCRSLVERYFSDVRPSLEAYAGEDSDVAKLDTCMQQLLQISHKNSATSKYKTAIKDIKKHLVLLDARLVAAPPRSIGAGRPVVDDRIVDTLQVLLPSAAASYEQALIDLSQSARLSWRGPATDLREALRETLDHLAPDNDVVGSVGYKPEKDTSGPTMKQKVRYILSSRSVGKSMSAPTIDATRAIDEALGAFVRSVYTRSNVSTHTSTSRDEALRVLDLVRVVMSELLEVR